MLRIITLATSVGIVSGLLFFVLALLLRPDQAAVEAGQARAPTVAGAAFFGFVVALVSAAIVAVISTIEEWRGQR